MKTTQKPAPIAVLNALSVHLGHVISVTPVVESGYHARYQVNMSAGMSHEVFDQRRENPDGTPTAMMPREEFVALWMAYHLYETAEAPAA